MNRLTPFFLTSLLAMAGCATTAPGSTTPLTNAPSSATKTDADAAKLEPQDRNAFFVHYARSGDLASVEKEIDAGIDVNVHDNLGQTALIAAVSHNLLPIVQSLLDHKVDPNGVDSAGWSPLHYAAYFGAGSEVMDLLVAGGANVNLRNDRGITPLYFATASAHEIQVSFLIAHHADRTIASNAGVTPLQLANTKGFDLIASLLDPAKVAGNSGRSR